MNLKTIGKCVLFAPILLVAGIIIVFVGIGLYFSKEDQIDEDYKYFY